MGEQWHREYAHGTWRERDGDIKWKFLEEVTKSVLVLILEVIYIAEN